MEVEKISACRACKSLSIKPFFDLGAQPLANSLLKSPDDPEKFYPLSLSFCENCSLVQLNQTVDPKVLFSNYLWVTGTSKTANVFATQFYKELVARRGGTKAGYVLELASNDGTFLLPFIRDGYKVLGVDPAQNVVDIAIKNGGPTKCVFFGEKAAKKILREHGPASMIFARNVLAHVANMHDFLEGTRMALADDGVAAIEPHYAKVILEGLQYDSIYHEHLCYFSLKSLEKLFNDHGLFVFDAIESPISGGAIIVYAKKEKTDPSKNLLEFRKRENENKTNEFASWQDFAKRAFAHKQKFFGMMSNVRNKLSDILKDDGAKKPLVIGWGASARSSTLLNFCGLGSDIIPAIIDLNSLKQGLWTAGTRIPVVKPETALALKPDYILILAWNFSNEIIEMLKTKYDFRGSFIVPLPEFKIIK